MLRKKIENRKVDERQKRRYRMDNKLVDVVKRKRLHPPSLPSHFNISTQESRRHPMQRRKKVDTYATQGPTPLFPGTCPQPRHLPLEI
jgi:hypothetical protein